MSTLLAPRFKLSLHETHNTWNANIFKHAHSQFFFVLLCFSSVFDKSTSKLKRWRKKQQINVNAWKRLECLQGNIFAKFISRNTFCWLIYLVVKLKKNPIVFLYCGWTINTSHHICSIRIVHNFNGEIEMANRLLLLINAAIQEWKERRKKNRVRKISDFITWQAILISCNLQKRCCVFQCR